MVWMSLMKKHRRRSPSSQSPSSSSSPERSPGSVNKTKSGDNSGHKNRSSFFGGGSKHKRRLFRKDSSITEACSLSSKGSVQSDGASWRVENIRDAAPTADEWWEDVAAPPTSSASAPASCRVDSDDVHDNAIATKVAVLFSPSALTSPSRQKRFHNVGLETWLRVREEWKQRTVESLPGRPTPAEHSQLVKGLARSSALRTYELPRRMVLSDLISVYNDIWEGDL